MQTPACRFIIIHGIRIKSHTPADFIIFLFIIKRKYSKYSSLSLDPFWVTWLAIVFPPLYPIQTKSSNPHGSWNESMSDETMGQSQTNGNDSLIFPSPDSTPTVHYYARWQNPIPNPDILCHSTGHVSQEKHTIRSSSTDWLTLRNRTKLLYWHNTTSFSKARSSSASSSSTAKTFNQCHLDKPVSTDFTPDPNFRNRCPYVAQNLKKIHFS